ncbi:MAG: apolipoprotein N-acyltransferase [Cyclobacteriaceae bacterium]|nr:MAG: apolipoprotein N-acyltransferase [Cyclobacteriaceae bacterium]
MWGAATLSGLLLWLAWPVGPGAPLLFVAWLPLLWVEQNVPGKRAGLRFFLMAWWACLIWNLGTTWWIYYSTAAGSVVAILANAFLMTIPWMLFRITRKMAGDAWGYLSWVLYWCSFEQIHLNWEISWPWLTLGNGFAMFPEWIQWYEYTGVFGGTLWILLVNLGLFRLLLSGEKTTIKLTAGLIAGLSLPIIISYMIFFTYQEQGPEVEFVVIQPNVDPFTEKFINSENFIGFEQQVDRFIQLSEQKLTDDTSFLLWPESAIDGFFEESLLKAKEIPLNARVLQPDKLKSLIKIREFKRNRPKLSLLTGLTSYQIYKEASLASPTSRRDGEVYYDQYNTAYFAGDDGTFQTYHKSRLVPGPETMPYPKVFGFLSDLLVDFGGTSGQMGKQTERTVFFNSKGVGLAPSICYESIYGDFMAKYVRNGAHFIGVITNDGWWRDSPGHKHHLHYAVLRAIENRRSVARSANTGISAFINQRGDILQPTKFWDQDVLKSTLKANDELTFYSKHGDYIGRTAVWLSILVFLAAWVKKRIT